MKNKNRRPNLYVIAGPNEAGKTTFEESGKLEILDSGLFDILLKYKENL